MYKMRTVLVMLIGVSLFLGAVGTAPVYACSGQPGPYSEVIEHIPTIAKAQIIALDDTGGNGLLRVESYLKGTGPEYLLLFENSIGRNYRWVYELWPRRSAIVE